METSSGYYYFYDPRHPLANKTGTVYFHRHVASIMIGHWLKKDEHVHHLDGNKLNNDPNNLEILSPKEHGLIEWEKRYGKPMEKPNCCCCGGELGCGWRESKYNICINCFYKNIR